MTTPQSVLQTVFGFDSFRPGQEDIIEAILSKTNILTIMPTGAGKSLCYQIPGLIFDRPSIIISPLVALMDNQVAALRSSGAAVSCIHSGQSREQNIEAWRGVTHGQTKLLYMSPERLMSSRMLSALDALKPAMFVIDEAHCVSKWGPAFRPEYGELSALHSRFPQAVIAAFTATADTATRKDIASTLFGTDAQERSKTIVHGFDRPNLELAVQAKTNRNAQLLAFMKEKQGQSGIVYCLSRKSTEQTAALLSQNGFTALPYHAGLLPQERFDNQERFMAEDGVIMAATIAFGMGIDKPDIRFVFHMNLPSSMEAYYQEIGRAGRDGLPAQTAMLYGLDDVRMRHQFIADANSAKDHQIREHKRLDALLAYCESTTCRRQILLQYFGEASQPCGNCDNCLNPPEQIDATAQAKLIFAAIFDTGQRFGASHVIDVCRGAKTQRITDLGHERLHAYGAGNALSKRWLQSLIRQAVGSGYLQIDISRFGALRLTPKAQGVMDDQDSFMCREIKLQAKGTASQRTARKKAVASDNFDEKDAKMLGQLKALRMRLARAIGKPAFVVFPDATLIDMVHKRPATKAEMLNVSGVGEVKYQRFGAEFLKILSEN